MQKNYFFIAYYIIKMSALENIIQQVGGSSNLPRSNIIAATINTNEFQLPTGASAGYILSSDSKGNASWVNAGSVDITTATGTPNQVAVNGSYTVPQTGSLEFSLPQDIAPTSDVIFSSLKLTSLLADKLVYVDSENEILSATDLHDWITGTPNQVIATDGDVGTIVLSTPQDIGTSSDVKFANATLSGLTASRLVATDGTKKLVSTTANALITGTPNQVIVTDDLDGTVTLSTPQDIATSSSPTFTGLSLVNPLAIAHGGTGRNNAISKSIPYIDSSGNWQFFTITDGQLLIGSTGNTPVAATLTAGSNITITNSAGGITIASSGIGVSSAQGTANQVLINGLTTAQTGTCVFTLPQSIGTGSTPTFQNLILSLLGSNQYVKSGTGSGFTSVSSIPATDITGISATAPVTYSAGTVALSYNGTNLQNSAGSLDTIQNIDQSATPIFQGATFQNYTVSPPQVNIFSTTNDAQGGLLKFYKSRGSSAISVSDTLGELGIYGSYSNGGGTIEKKSFQIITTVTNTANASAATTTTFANITGGSLTTLLTLSGSAVTVGGNLNMNNSNIYLKTSDTIAKMVYDATVDGPLIQGFAGISNVINGTEIMRVNSTSCNFPLQTASTYAYFNSNKSIVSRSAANFTSDVRTQISATSPVLYDNTTGIISFGTTLTEGTTANTVSAVTNTSTVVLQTGYFTRVGSTITLYLTITATVTATTRLATISVSQTSMTGSDPYKATGTATCRGLTSASGGAVQLCNGASITTSGNTILLEGAMSENLSSGSQIIYNATLTFRV